MGITFLNNTQIACDWNDIKNRLFLSPRPTKQVTAIEGLLYESIGPLALVPGILQSRYGDEISYSFFYKDDIWKLGVTPEEVITQAKRNGEKLFHTVAVESPQTVALTSFVDNDPRKKRPCPFGCAQIFYGNNLEHFKEKLGADYYIMPISRSEVILVSEKVAMKTENILFLLKLVNGIKAVSPEEDKLGNFILLYKNGKVSVAAEG